MANSTYLSKTQMGIRADGFAKRPASYRDPKPRNPKFLKKIKSYPPDPDPKFLEKN